MAFALDKPVGPTAAQALDLLRAQDPSLRDVKLGHAGRLDPMAEGLLTVLVGEETRAVHAWRGQEKTYEVDVLLGAGTDSFDELGRVVEATEAVVQREAIERVCAGFVGRYAQRYPPFSQARVGGRSLLAWSREGVPVERPVADRVLHAVELLGVATTDAAVASRRARERIAWVRGDFRQEAIDAQWAALAAERPSTRWTVATLRVRCSAGTYMRALAYDVGAALGVPAIAARIRRTRAGAMTLEGARVIAVSG